MARNRFARAREEASAAVPPQAEETAPAPVRAPAARPEGGLTAFIGAGARFEGRLEFERTVRIDGTFVGEVETGDELVVGAGGRVEARIRAGTLTIAGTVVGDVEVRERLVLESTAVLQGDVDTASLRIEEGAVLEGRVTMKKAAAGSQAPLKAIQGGSAGTGAGA